MTAVRERFNPHPMGVDSSFTIRGSQMGGFLAKTAGTITVTSTTTDGLNPLTLVDAHPMLAGNYVPIPIMFPANSGATVTLAGGASGTLMV